MFEADDKSDRRRWPLVRLKAGSRTEVTLLSAKFFAISTHFLTSTVPCAGTDCALCEYFPVRGLYYLAVLCDSRVALLELGALSSCDFEAHAKLYGVGLCPGAVFEVSRRGAKSPVRSEFLRASSIANPISEVELATRVMALYKFPPPQPGEDIESYDDRCQRLALVRNEQHAQRWLAKREATYKRA